MLASITPLGERARRQRWPVTTAAYLLTSLAGGGLLGAALGAVGGLLPGGARWPLVAAATVCAAGAALEATGRLPSPRRQVDERWLTAYRGWVYGAGFGLQLGAGVLTIVTSASTYAVFALALLSRGAATGALVGAAYGLARGLPLLSVRRVTTPDALRALHRRVQRGAAPVRRASLAGQVAAAVALAVGGSLR